MKLINKKVELKDVAECWKKQYPNSENEIYQQLLNLPENSTADEVANIIGNRSWISDKFCCDDCRNSVNDVVELGEEPKDKSRTIRICKDCLRKALYLIRSKK